MEAAPLLPFSDEQPADRPPAREPVHAAKSGDFALAGKDGIKAKELLASSQAEGAKVLAALCEEAFSDAADAIAGGHVPERLFTDEQRKRLANALAATNATADLLGRSRVRERQQKAVAAKGLHKLRDEQPFESFATVSIQPLSPERAIAYFKNLVPSLATRPGFLANMQRDAFTLAVNTDQVLLGRVKQIIQSQLEQGTSVNDAVADIGDLLDQAGVSPRNPQYSEMVFRTNAMDAYNTGASQEMRDPDVADTFPVWQYLGIRDGRQGADHEPHFDLFYPNSASFEEVRGDRPFNCRCTFRPVDKWEWEELQQAGETVERSW